tara:strand:+ start:11347 stop:12807 length:1461 start_codon:yes stop_codon:yes gene_type:complete
MEFYKTGLNMQKFSYLLLLLTFFLLSCGEEVLTKNTQSTGTSSPAIQNFALTTCSEFHFEKPPVDILYIVDNSGSTLAGSFQSIKTEIQNTIFSISNEFDYHIYFAPLNQGGNESIYGYPVILSNPDSVPSVASLNVVAPENLQMFSQASGNNSELGFQRAQNIINSNRNIPDGNGGTYNNGIFRDNAHTIVVMISNGNDTEANINVQGNTVIDQGVYTNRKNKFIDYLSAPMSAESFRFMSLVAHSSCKSGWVSGSTYRQMSQDIYQAQGLTDNNANKDSYNLCSGDYSNIFKAVNNSIRQIVVGHKYDHWKISSASEDSIQADDITLHKVDQNGNKTLINEDSQNGFEYIGYQQNKNQRIEPTPGEPATGLFVKLNGSAQVAYPDCLIAKTRTPTEYFGYFALPKDPDLTTVEVTIDGAKIQKSDTNGWSYIGWRDVLNIKVPGPTNASVSPAVNKSGYFIKLNGDAIYTNGQTIKVFYKAKAI